MRGHTISHRLVTIVRRVWPQYRNRRLLLYMVWVWPCMLFSSRPTS